MPKPERARSLARLSESKSSSAISEAYVKVQEAREVFAEINAAILRDLGIAPDTPAPEQSGSQNEEQV